MATRTYRTPKYTRSDEEVARDYEKLAEHYERIAADDARFNAERRRAGKPVVKAVQNSERKHTNRAKRMREMADKARRR